jgi:hypothetical protein
MLGRRSLNLDLTSLDPKIERTLRRSLRNSVEMGDNMHGDENERNRGENVDHTRTLRDLFAPVATNFPSCIVLPPTNSPSQPAPSYQAPTQAPASSSQSSLEDSLKAFIQLTGQSINDVKNATMVNTQAIAKMETQIR